MLYKKNKAKELSPALFANPTAEYRGAPFWAWNCRLQKDELLRQVDVLRDMGFGGFHMHVRSGMDTEYLGDEFMDLIEACADKAEKRRMLAYLYDEDRWPSGFAGGLVTRDPKYRIRYLLFTPFPYRGDETPGSFAPQDASAKRTGNGTLLARFDVALDQNGCLSSFRRLADGEEAEHATWFAYIESPNPSPRYNMQTYANLMDKPSIDRFLEVTHEAYKRRVGSRFGKSIPSIFTDEPQFTTKQTLAFPDSRQDVALPWTDDLPATFAAAYGKDLISHLPELIWELPEGVSEYRYLYHDHACQRFTDAFAKNVGAWCQNNGISLTGHMMRESTLSSQTGAVGEVMRSLSAFHLPGIDMLGDWHEYTTAKQAASVAHQYGREGVMSELYGVTGWDFDFRGHKLQGDWQAALGVTLRVPHLSWVSMKGEAKRDYPASINYQSSWFKKYSYVEDHFARVNTAMTRGKPVVRVGVIHPVESLWLHWGPSAQTQAARAELDRCFENVTSWLLFGGIDFDYISESLLPEECPKAGNPLRVGCMAYDAVVVPCLETLRSTTLERLTAFRKAGGKLIFAGDAPKYLDAKPSSLPAALWAESVHTDFTRTALLGALEDVRLIDLRNQDGSAASNLLYQLREDKTCRWLFVAHGGNPYNKDLSRYQNLRIRIRGSFTAELYDTLSGRIRAVPCSYENGDTVISRSVCIHDSLLFRLIPAQAPVSAQTEVRKASRQILHSSFESEAVPFTLNEPNVLLLDKFEYSFDGGAWQGPEEILRIDTALRKSLRWTPWGGSANQPWCITPEPVAHVLKLRCRIHSDFCLRGARLALEDARDTKITVNGSPIVSDVIGWYTDKSIETVRLPALPAGDTELSFEMPFGKRTAAERMYLLGNFSVAVRGTSLFVRRPEKTLGFASITEQGLPFYGGSVTYTLETETQLPHLEITLPHYRATVFEVALDGGKPVTGAFAPYRTEFTDVAPGRHRVQITLYISRHNAFGNIHCADAKVEYPAPGTWRSTGDSWTYSYRLLPEGLLSAPILREYEL